MNSQALNGRGTDIMFAPLMANSSMMCLGRQVAVPHSSHGYIVYDRPLAVATFQDLVDKR